MNTKTAIAKITRLDTDIAALRERLEAKLDERQALVADLFAEGEAIRAALEPVPAVTPPAAPVEVPRVGRLDPEVVRHIRDLHSTGVSQAELGRRYNLSQPSVNAIVRRQSYKDVA